MNINNISAQFDINQPFLFDDFKYDNVDYPSNDSNSKSLYGYNPWLTKDGYVNDRAWARWNYGYPEFCKKCSTLINEKGFSLRAEPGIYDKNDLKPGLHSTFYFKHGTFACRLKYEQISKRNALTQAYWLYSPFLIALEVNGKNMQYIEEMDFEWNNWWDVAGDRVMAVGSNKLNYLFPEQMYLKCILEREGRRFSCNCNDTYEGESVIGGQWVISVFVVDTMQKTIKIYLTADDLKGGTVKLWGGKSSDVKHWGEPFLIQNYEVLHDLCVVYDIGFGNELKDPSQMDVDWYFYTPRTDVTADEINKFVKELQSKNLPRINTTGRKFNNDFYHKEKGDVYFEGPRKIKANEESSWVIKWNGKYWDGYNASFRYRFHVRNGIYSDWFPIYHICPHITPSSIYDTLELELTMYDFWHKFRDTLHLKVPIIDNESKSTDPLVYFNIYPNPSIRYSVIEFTLDEACEGDLSLYDKKGSLVMTFHSGEFKAGNYYFELTNRQVAEGLYFLNLRYGSRNETRQLMLFK